jgi:hypothetical protein
MGGTLVPYYNGVIEINWISGIKNSQSGLSLTEIMISITLIGFIVAVFMPLFVHSASNNSKSISVLDATYLGKDVMEFVYNLSGTVPFESLEEILVDGNGYVDLPNTTYGYEYEDRKYLCLKFSEAGNLVRVVATIYKNSAMDSVEAQFESLYAWTGRGILSEE